MNVIMGDLKKKRIFLSSDGKQIDITEKRGFEGLLKK